jgi:hypothetical protein
MQAEATLPVTIIPAQPRGQTWSPDILVQQQRGQYEETSATAGLNLTRVPTAIEEEMSSPTQSSGGTRSSDSALNSSSPDGSSRASHVRFAPNIALGANGSSDVLGSQTVSHSEHQVGTTQHTSTNHDR